jgi:prophage antirepressor-like protein
MNEIKVFENVDFGKVRIIEQNGEPWFVGKDVAMILGYAKPENAIATHVDEEDKTTTLIRGTGTNYKSKAVIINESGLYSLILSSKLPGAKQFKRWVTSEVIPSIRKTGKYSARRESSESTQARLINAKVRFARELQRMAEIETLSPTYKQILIAQAAEMLTGVQMPLPKLDSRTYSAGEVGKMLGVSANKIGRVAKEHNMKTDEFGAWYHDKSPYSSKEVDSFRYNEKAIEKLRELLADKAVTDNDNHISL